MREWHLPTLPSDAEVIRASGHAICTICGLAYAEHPEYVYESGCGTVHKACFEEFGREVYLHL